MNLEPCSSGEFLKVRVGKYVMGISRGLLKRHGNY